MQPSPEVIRQAREDMWLTLARHPVLFIATLAAALVA